MIEADSFDPNLFVIARSDARQGKGEFFATHPIQQKVEQSVKLFTPSELSASEFDN
jgi:methionyl-tRNA formyltransferase